MKAAVTGVILAILVVAGIALNTQSSNSYLQTTSSAMTTHSGLQTINGISRIELRTHDAKTPSHAVIWLHGLGATADDFVPIVPYLNLVPDLSIKFVFPQAPDRPITINGGMRMPGWYDIKGLSIQDKQDSEGMTQSAALVATLISELNEQGIESSNILLAGFSQGGAVIYHQGLRHPEALAGLIALSTYLPFADEVARDASLINKKLPILINHGQYDAVVPLAMGEVSAQRLTELGYSVSWQVYPMEHEVVMEQIQALGAWINDRFDPSR